MKIKANSLVALSTYSMLSMVVPYVAVLGIIVLAAFNNMVILKKIIMDFSPFFLLILFLIMYSFYLGNEEILIMHHARDFFIFAFSSIFLTSCCQSMKNGVDIIYNCIKKMFVFMGLLKIFTLFYAFYFDISSYNIHYFFTQILHIAMMTTDTENQYLFRINFAFDSTIPFVLFFLIKELSSNNKKNIIYVEILVILISLLISMSRALWFLGIFFIFLSFLFEFDFKRKIKFLFSFFVITVILLLTTDIFKYISDVVKVRFGSSGSDDNYYSDLTRHIQNEAIYKNFVESPLFGNGIGFYIKSFVRDQVDKYLYESQSFSLLMDLGIIGLIVFISMVFAMILKYNYFNKKALFFALVFFSVWLVSGSFNPFLLGSSGAMVIFFSINAQKLLAYVDNTKYKLGT
jgi:hypothetical protein